MSEQMARRILIRGGSGAGKSTLGAELARRLDLPFVELDALHHGPNWTAASAAELTARVRALLDDERGWVVDGNYDEKLGSLLLERAELIVWLDLALGLKLLRLARRTARRWVRREELWNGNRESFKDAFWGDRRQLFLHSNDNYSCRAGAGLMERQGDQRAFRIGLGKAVA